MDQARSDGGTGERALPPLSPKGWHMGGAHTETKKEENEKMKRMKRKMKERRKKGEKIGIKSNF